MKIRSGFVSNSSSSSFLMFGIILDEEISLQAFIENLDDPKKITKYAKELLEGKPVNEDLDPWEVMEVIGDMLPSGFSCYIPYEEEMYVGRSWSSVGDDETGRMFKDSTEKTLKKFFGEDIEVSTHKEAWNS